MNANVKDSDQQVQQFEQQRNFKEAVLSPQETVQNLILDAEEVKQKLRQKVNILSEDVEFKLEQLLEDIRQNDGKSFQSIIQLRMQELAFNKILVLTYEKSYFRLVAAHFHIGKQYLRFQCFEQAIQHLSSAVNRNTQNSQNSHHVLYNSYINTYLGQAFYKTKKYEESISLLRNVLKIHEQLESDGHKNINNVRTLTYLAKSLAETNNSEAIKVIQNALKKAASIYKQTSRVYALTLHEKAKINKKFNKKEQSIQQYLKSIQILKNSNENDVELDLIQIYQQVAELYQNSRDIQKYISTLKDKYQVYEDSYGNADKKSIKQQRSYATVLLKHKKIDESLQEFEDILEKEQKVYGQNSLQVGKQYKSIANIYIAKNQYKEAQLNFKKALKIFNDLGDQRLVRQVRIRLSSFQNKV